eukprot:3407762-Pyramimonas_sp.AAC.1
MAQVQARRAAEALASFVRAVCSGHLPRMGNVRCVKRKQLVPPLVMARQAGWTEAWRHHQMSTFEYLMLLNSVAGRSYRDLAQYPVFPWVLADYTR